MLLDEPSTGLDPVSKRRLWRVLREHKEGRAMVLTTHSMVEAEALSTRIGAYVCMYVCVFRYVCVCIHTYTCVYVYIHIYTCAYIHVCIYVCVDMGTGTVRYRKRSALIVHIIYMHHTYKHTHTHIHMCVYTCM